jgi:membrane-associated HD superfamily phosphohydrolase
MPEVSLPLKTRVATWWIAVVTLIAVVVAIVIVVQEYQKNHHEELGLELAIYIFLILGVSILFLLPVILVELRKKWSWIAAIILLTIEIYFSTGSLFMAINYLAFLGLLAYIIPLGLIFFDRRNYWNMLCERSAMRDVPPCENEEVVS